MVKLIDVMGTRYLYESWRTPVTKYLREHPGETIDLADARLTSAIATLVSGAIASQTHTFVDTANPERNALLAYNAEQAKLAVEVKKNLRPLPIPRNDKEVQEELARQFDADAYYELKTYNEGYNMLWAILLQAARPDVKLYTTPYARELFKTIQKYYNPVHYAGKTVLYLDGAAICEQRDASTAFCTSHICIPAEFGRENLFQRADWEEPLKLILKVFYSYIHRTGYHIKDFLQQGV